MKQFFQECLQLYDISPSLAGKIVYGSWPTHRPGDGFRDCGFNENDYHRYSEAARREVISAIVKYEKKNDLSDIIYGLMDTPDFLKELTLWEDWGVDKGFIINELDEYLTLKVYQYGWLKAELFAEIMDYIDLKLSAQEASEWMDGVNHKFDITPEIQKIFAESITKHTV